MKQPTIASLLTFDIKASTGSKNVQAENHLENLFLVRTSGKSVVSQAPIDASSPSDLISECRNAFFCGKIDLAKQIAYQGLEKSKGDTEINEFLLELARIAWANSNWPEAEDLCIRICASKASSLTQLTANQIMSSVLFEVGRFGQSEQLIKLTRARFEHLYPEAGSLFQLRCLLVCLALRTTGEEKARQVLVQMIHDYSGRMTVDKVLSVLRLSIDIKRVVGSNYSSEALGCWLLSRCLQDEFYVALAEFDLWILNSNEAKEWFGDPKSKYLRISNLLSEIEGTGAASVTGSTMKKFIDSNHNYNFSPGFLTIGKDVQYLYLSTHDLIVNFKDQKVLSLKRESLHARALFYMKSGKTSLDEFVQQTWKVHRFHKLKHSSNVRNLISNLKTKFGISVLGSDQEVEIQDRIYFL